VGEAGRLVSVLQFSLMMLLLTTERSSGCENVLTRDSLCAEHRPVKHVVCVSLVLFVMSLVMLSVVLLT